MQEYGSSKTKTSAVHSRSTCEYCLIFRCTWWMSNCAKLILCRNLTGVVQQRRTRGNHHSVNMSPEGRLAYLRSLNMSHTVRTCFSSLRCTYPEMLLRMLSSFKMTTIFDRLNNDKYINTGNLSHTCQNNCVTH